MVIQRSIQLNGSRKASKKQFYQLSHGWLSILTVMMSLRTSCAMEGYYVVSNDHLGHGKSIQGKTEYGYFNEKYGNACVLGDMHTRCRQDCSESTPGFRISCWGTIWDQPLCASTHSDNMATVWKKLWLSLVWSRIRNGSLWRQPKGSAVLCFFQGWHYRDKLIDNLAIRRIQQTTQAAEPGRLGNKRYEDGGCICGGSSAPFIYRRMLIIICSAVYLRCRKESIYMIP